MRRMTLRMASVALAEPWRCSWRSRRNAPRPKSKTEGVRGRGLVAGAGPWRRRAALAQPPPNYYYGYRPYPPPPPPLPPPGYAFPPNCGYYPYLPCAPRPYY